MNSFNFVDLTHPLEGTVPTWTGSCGFRSEIKMDYPEGCRVQQFKMHAGVGTHLDAPSHFFSDGLNVGDLPLDRLIVPAIKIDVKRKVDSARYMISPEDIIDFEKKYQIPKGALVLGDTGWGRYWKDKERYRNQMQFPGFLKETVDLLLKRGIVGVGIDTLSPDGSDMTFPVHHRLLGAGGYILENVANLDNVPEIGFYVAALPLRISEATESAIRCVAFIPR